MSLTGWANMHRDTDTQNVVKYHVEPRYQSQSVNWHQWVPIHQLCSLVTMGTTDPYLRQGLEKNVSHFHTSNTVLPKQLERNAEREWEHQFHGRVAEKKEYCLYFSQWKGEKQTETESIIITGWSMILLVLVLLLQPTYSNDQRIKGKGRKTPVFICLLWAWTLL